jgi:DNA-binding MarR family transcriptional regulator
VTEQLTTQERVLLYIRRSSYSPSVREIAAALEGSPSAVQHHLDKLEADGWIRRGGRERRIEVRHAELDRQWLDGVERDQP